VKLFHGSNLEIPYIDLEKCRPFKDFGKGFYTTPFQNQAWTMARRTVRIYGNGKPWISEFFFDETLLNSGGPNTLKIRRFSKPDNEWALFVTNNRNRKFHDYKNPECNIDGKYDIVIGPVANDDIAALINTFLSGIISEDALARELAFRDLSIQYSFHTECAAALLQKTGAYYE
jgi:hypothetical protein